MPGSTFRFLTQVTVEGVAFGGLVSVARGHSSASTCPVPLGSQAFPSCFFYLAISICNGMVSYTAPNNIALQVFCQCGTEALSCEYDSVMVW